MSRGSLKSDPFAGNEDTSSISARSDTSIDSYVFEHSFGKYYSFFIKRHNSSFFKFIFLRFVLYL